MSTVRRAVFLFSLLGILHGINAAAVSEAPGDHDQNCRVGIFEQEHIFPEEWEVLVDTYDYTFLYGSLFGRSVWKAMSYDDDSATVISYNFSACVLFT